MRPFNRNNEKKLCVETSSNCVEWNGGSVQWLGIDDGDSLSLVLLKSLQQLLLLKEGLDLNGLDLSVLYGACKTCPNETHDVKDIVGLLIEKFKELERLIGNRDNTPSEDTVVIDASCFGVQRNDDGDVITELPVRDYVRMLSKHFCAKLSNLERRNVSKTEFDNALSNVLSELNKLRREDNVLSYGLMPFSSNGNPIEVSIGKFIELLEASFLEVRELIGSKSAVFAGLNPVDFSNHYNKISNSRELLLASGANTIGDAMRNMWSCIVDLRSAVSVLMDNYAISACAHVVVDFDTKLVFDDNAISGRGIRLYFNQKTRIAGGFQDYDVETGVVGSRFLIRDKDNKEHSFVVDVKKEMLNSKGYFVNLEETSLSLNSDYVVEGTVFFKSGEQTCVKHVRKEIGFDKDPICGYCTVKGIGVVGSKDKFIIVYE